MHLDSKDDVERAQSMGFCPREPNDAKLKTERDWKTGANKQVKVKHYSCVRFFRYLKMIDNAVIEAMDKKLDTAIITKYFDELITNQFNVIRYPKGDTSNLIRINSERDIPARVTVYCLYEGPKDLKNYW